MNSKGQFNVPFNGKDKVYCFTEDNIQAMHKYFHKRKPIILSKDFAEAVRTAKAGDFVYFDPPYDSTKQTMYLGGFEKDRFFDFCRSLKCKYAISYDGGVVGENASASIPNDIFKEAVAIDAMRNMRQTFKSDKYKTEITSKTLQRFEMLYLNYEQHDTEKIVSHKLF